MQSVEFNELSGRVEGLCRTLMLLAVEAEESKVISPGFSVRLKQIADGLNFDSQDVLVATQRTLCEISDGIEHAHKHRQGLVG